MEKPVHARLAQAEGWCQKFFVQLGIVTGDGGEWIRKQALILAKNWSTPVPYWLSVSLPDLKKWIDASNEAVRESEKK